MTLKKSKLDIPFAPIERLIKKETGLRVSFSAVESMTEELIYKGKKIGEKAWKIAQHSGRRTVTDKDIKLAYEQFR
jgi:DNA-binding protein